MDFELRKRNRLGLLTVQAQKRKKGGVLLLGLLLASAFVTISISVLSPKPPSPSAIPGSPEERTAIQAPPALPQHPVIWGRIRERGTLFQSMEEEKIPRRWIDLVVLKLKPFVNFKKIKGGTYRFIADEKGEMVRFIYEAGPTEVFEIEKGPEGYMAQKKEVPLESYLVKVSGEIHSSLFETMDSLGEQDPLVIFFAEILASEIDFYQDVRAEDRFKVIVEKMYKGNAFIRYGVIHAVEYQRGEKTIRGIEYQGAYYNEKGISLRKAFLKAPLRFNRISSKFSRSRKHPILGGVRPHYGVDYAAPMGTPIWAVADGAVVSCGWGGGYGNQVVLRHGNGYLTCYGHLSRYGHGIRKGVRVLQKQILGYVGSTGLSTGPHLDYRLVKDGRFKNPLRESFPEGPPIGKEEREKFEKRRDEVLSWLEGEKAWQRKREDKGAIP